MSLDDEVKALRKMIRLPKEEPLLETTEGNVHGPGVDGRSGILFLTNQRVGVSAEASFFTQDAHAFFWLSDVVDVASDCTEGEHGDIRIRSSSGTMLLLSSAVIDSRVLTDHLFATIMGAVNRTVRRELTSSYERGAALAESGRLDEATSLLQQVLAAQPSCVPALTMMGYVYKAQEQYTEAATSFALALDAGSNDRAGLQEERAFCLLFGGELDQSIELATSLIDEGHEGAMAYKCRGRAREQRGDLDGAFSDYQRAVERAPDDDGAWWCIADFAVDRRDATRLAEAVDRLKALGQHDKAREFEPALHNLRKDYAAAFQSSYAQIDDPGLSLRAAAAMLESAERVKPELCDELLQRLDPRMGGAPLYDMWSGSLLFAARRPQESLVRLTKVQFNDTPAIQAMLSMIKAAAAAERSAWDEVLTVANPILAAGDEWIGGSESSRESWVSLWLFKGKALLAKGHAQEALEALRQVEGTTDFGVRWLNEEFPSLLEAASREVGAASLRQVPSGGQTLGAYALLQRLGDELARSGRLGDIAARVRTDSARFDEPPLVAVMGEYSVGKSSFINALVRRPLLPTGEGVTTGTITILRHGQPERMRAVFADGRVVERERLASVEAFVKETGASSLPHHVDVFLDAEILKQVQIVDSPGLNAPFQEHRKITEGYLAEADAILWLFNVENAGKSGEKEFLDRLASFRRKAVAVVNQIDLVAPSDVRDTLEYVEECFPSTFATVMGVSAKRALDGLARRDDSLVAKSGLPALETWLEANILGAARQIKEASAREKVKEAIAEVVVARQSFDQRVEQQAKGIQTERAALSSWYDGELRRLITTQCRSMQQEIERHLATLIVAIAQRSGPSTMAPPAAVEPLARSFHASCVTAMSVCDEAIGKAYDARLGTSLESLRPLEGAEWQNSMRSAQREFSLRRASWRKDLADYLEQVSSFLDGFITGRGMSFTQLDAADGQYNSQSALMAAFRPRLAFVWERTEGAITRWLLELRTNSDDLLARLERELRTEAAHVREEGYRKVERLGAAL